MRNKKGFTIVEILVALAIGGIVMGAAYSMYISQQRSYQITEDVSALQQNLRSAMYFLERDLRMAGYNPTKASNYFGFTDLTLTSPELFRFTMDSETEDGVLGAGETITYSFQDNTLRRDTGGGPQIIADNITDVSFDFFKQNGDPPANGSEVRRVEVALTASEGEHTRDLSAMVRCRNMGL
ncbi:prepilin-type N-terminal cleavage/methylation domain-containing protein [Deltaproteobacteria bacterium]|nr:prepilin-type N-terminal cleavage/methylation domain-containing protein [Deltaproteobacteria bacterium]